MSLAAVRRLKTSLLQLLRVLIVQVAATKTSRVLCRLGISTPAQSFHRDSILILLEFTKYNVRQLSRITLLIVSSIAPIATIVSNTAWLRRLYEAPSAATLPALFRLL